MKILGQTLAVLTAALVVVEFWLVIGRLSGGSTATMAGEMHTHGMESGGFSLANIVQILPTLVIVAVVTAIVAPIKQRLLNKRRVGAQVRRPHAATPAI